MMSIKSISKQGSRRTRLDERSLEHVRQERKHRVQRREILLLPDLAVLDASKELSEDGQVQDERSRKKRILKIEPSIDLVE